MGLIYSCKYFVLSMLTFFHYFELQYMFVYNLRLPVVFSCIIVQFLQIILGFLCNYMLILIILSILIVLPDLQFCLWKCILMMMMKKTEYFCYFICMSVKFLLILTVEQHEYMLLTQILKPHTVTSVLFSCHRWLLLNYKITAAELSLF